jgi:hypothetical protein
MTEHGAFRGAYRRPHAARPGDSPSRAGAWPSRRLKGTCWGSVASVGPFVLLGVGGQSWLAHPVGGPVISVGASCWIGRQNCRCNPPGRVITLSRVAFHVKHGARPLCCRRRRLAARLSRPGTQWRGCQPRPSRAPGALFGRTIEHLTARTRVGSGRQRNRHGSTGCRRTTAETCSQQARATFPHASSDAGKNARRRANLAGGESHGSRSQRPAFTRCADGNRNGIPARWLRGTPGSMGPRDATWNVCR